MKAKQKLATMTTKFAIVANSENGYNLGYWTNSTDDITNGNPDLWETKEEVEKEIRRAEKIAQKKGWTCTFAAYPYEVE